MKSSLTLLPLLAGVLVSCAPLYQGPPHDPAETAVVRNSRKGDHLYNWERYAVEAIDGRPLGLSQTAAGREVALTAGSHDLVIMGAFDRGTLSQGPFQARAVVTTTVLPGRRYAATGKVEGANLVMWIRDSQSGQPASSQARVKYRTVPLTKYVPVYVPRKGPLRRPPY